MRSALLIAGIIVGAFSLLRLASLTGGVAYIDAFQQAMDALQDIVELGAVLGPFERHMLRPALDGLRGLGWTIAELQDHWRSVFVLMWLAMSAWANNRQQWEPQTAVMLVAGTICVLIYSVLAATVSINNPALAWYSVAGIILFISYVTIYSKRWVASVLAILTFSFMSAVARAMRDSTSLQDEPHALTILALSVASMGAAALFMGLLSKPGERLSNPSTQMGIYILGTMGLAVTLGALAIKGGPLS